MARKKKRKLSKKRERANYKIPLVTLLILIFLSFVTLAIIDLIDVSGYVEANVLEISGTTIIVGNNCTAIIAETSPERAYSIDLGIRGIIEERPNTHDTFIAAMKSFNITLESIQIENFNGRYYSASLFLMSDNKVSKIDTKPSDAIALALRMNSPIYINKTLLEEVGKNIC